MSRSVVVTGIGVFSALGDRPNKFFDALCQGETARKPISLFETKGLIPPEAGEIPEFDPRVYFGKKNYRPLNRTARLSVAAAQQALDMAGLETVDRESFEIGFVLGTMFCSVSTIAEFDRNALTAGPKYAKPMDFANTVINAAAGQTAIWHDLRGLNSTVAAGATSGVQAILQAADFIRAGRADILLAGGAEELSFESGLGFARLGLLAGGDDRPPRAVPFGAGRNGFFLGEGAAFLTLESAESAKARGAAPLAVVLGGASAYDASRGRDRAQATAAATRTLRKALKSAALTPGEVDVFSAAASGSPFSDAIEAGAMAETFGPDGVPGTAIKGALGEALGASGAFQAVSLIQAMRAGRLPGVAGMDQLDPELPAVDVRPETRERTMRRGLVNAFGFDGGCCSVAIGLPGSDA